MKNLAERRRRTARETFGNCRFRFAAEYIHEVDGGSDVTRRGNAWHRARALYIAALFKSQVAEDFELAEWAIQQALVEQPLPFEQETECRDLWARWTEKFRLPLAQFFAVETELPLFDTLLRFDLVLVPDRNTLMLDDGKTNWSIPSQDALDNAFQPAFYLTAARKLFPGFQRYRFRYDFARYGAYRFVEKTNAELDAIELMIETQDKAIAEAERTGEYPATAGAHCGTCMVANCPVVSNALRYGRVDGHNASETVREVAALHRAIEVRQAALRAYCDEHGGSVTGGGIEWKHRPVERRQYPAVKTLEVLEKHGVEYALYFNGTAIKPLVTSKRKYKDVEDEIKALAITAVKTEFRPKVVVEADEREYQDED